MAVHSDCWPLIPYLYILPLGMGIQFLNGFSPNCMAVDCLLLSPPQNLLAKETSEIRTTMQFVITKKCDGLHPKLSYIV